MATRCTARRQCICERKASSRRRRKDAGGEDERTKRESMELIFGTDVREHGHRAGRLAGFEVDVAARSIRKLIFSTDGELGSHALARPFSSVAAKDGDLEIREYTPSEEPAPPAVVLLSHSTRILRGGREVGR